MNDALKDRTILITGITDAGSLALSIARQAREEGANIVCSGLGRTEYHASISDRAADFLDKTYAAFEATVKAELGEDTPMFPLDVTLDGSIEDFCQALSQQNIQLDGFLHSIAMDKTIKAGVVIKSILDVTKDEFFSAMDVSAYSLVSLTRGLIQNNLLKKDSSILALSYLGAEKVAYHPYKNIGVAKAALERIVVELAYELGVSHNIKVNAIRFSPYTGSKAGSAIQGLAEAVEFCEKHSPLGNARPEDLAWESTYLLRPYGRVTGEIRNVDGGYHIRG
ncbi:MAG TPA: enoyl-ACP reductase [Leptospiraceae bacterium]|nr:enoyl-ACP reductase [Spirochaetaceae bacterium]HBS06811.1 enoyl-ACP reductase [Leptospiraceae bacterium]|tara:strand:+ start:10765 stop:11604 length:840 start_codon:yes stop_codon:yes gene_type:complete